MKKQILALLMAFTLLIPIIAFAADKNVPGQPFQYLQDQIDQLKNQSGGGGIKVYDANGQFLGFYAGLTPGVGAMAPGIFNPTLKLFFQIDFNPNSWSGEYGQIPKGSYSYSPTEPVKIYVEKLDVLIRTCQGDRFFVGRGEPFIANVIGLAGCSPMGSGERKVFETREVLTSEFPFTFPIAMPLRFE